MSYLLGKVQLKLKVQKLKVHPSPGKACLYLVGRLVDGQPPENEENGKWAIEEESKMQLKDKISQENREDVELPDVRDIRLFHAVLPLLPHHRHHQPFLRKILIIVAHFYL